MKSTPSACTWDPSPTPKAASPRLPAAALAQGLALGLALLCQCQGEPATRSPVQLRPNDHVQVTFQQGAGSGLQQTLVSQNRISAKEAYSRKGADASLKVAHLADLQSLLDKFAQHHFFEKAQPAAPAQTKQLLAVSINGASQVFAMLHAGTERSQQDLVDFIECKKAFVQIFNLNTGFSTGKTSATELEKTQAELQERARRLKEQKRKRAGKSGGGNTQAKSGRQ